MSCSFDVRWEEDRYFRVIHPKSSSWTSQPQLFDAHDEQQGFQGKIWQFDRYA